MAITPIFCCGFECGVSEAGNQLHWVNQATASYVTSPVRNGARALRCNPSAQNSGFTTRTMTVGSYGVMRFYIRIATAPSADAFLGGFSSVDFMGLSYKASDGKLYAAREAAGVFNWGSSGVSFTPGTTWHCIDIKVDVSANPWRIDVQVDGTVLGQSAPALAADSMTGLILGSDTTQTMDVYYDDVVASLTLLDYPIGAGKVLGFSPASDGTHTSTLTHIVKGTIATPVGAAIVAGTTDSFNWVNAKPIGGGATDSTRLINQQTSSATEYVEHGIEQTTEANGPRAVEVMGIYRHAAGQACNSKFKINDNGTENTTFDDTGNTNQTDVYFSKQYAVMPKDSAVWTLARFKALKLRFGYSGDANPDVYCRGWLVEAEFPPSGNAYTSTEAGSEPAAAGVVARKKASVRSLAGAQPAAAGVVTYDRKSAHRAEAGAEPYPTGVVAYDRKTAFRALAGAEPGATGVVARKTSAPRTLAGNAPAASGALARKKTALRADAGAEPAASGVLAYDRKTAYRAEAGAEPGATGVVARKTAAVRQVAGAEPAGSGTLSRTKAASRTVSGSEPASSGALAAAMIKTRALSGYQPVGASIADDFNRGDGALAGSGPWDAAAFSDEDGLVISGSAVTRT